MALFSGLFSAALILIIAAGSTGALADTAAKPAHAKTQKKSAKANQHEWHFIADDIRIAVSDIARASGSGKHDLFIVTSKGKRPLNHARFASAPLEAHMLMPTHQPSPSLFLLRKAGGADERCLVITPKGAIRELPAGDVFAVEKLHLLILLATEAKTAPTSLAVLDLVTGKIEHQLKDASRPREFLTSGKRYRLWLSDSEVLAEPTDSPPGASWLQFSIDGKQLEHVPPPEAEARKYLHAIPRLRWVRLRSPTTS